MANNLTVEGTRAVAGAVRHLISVDDTYWARTAEDPKQQNQSLDGITLVTLSTTLVFPVTTPKAGVTRYSPGVE